VLALLLAELWSARIDVADGVAVVPVSGGA